AKAVGKPPAMPRCPSCLEAEVGTEQEGLRLPRDVAVATLVDRGDIIFVEQIIGVRAQLDVVVDRITEHRVDDRIALGAWRRPDRAISPAPHSAGVAN